MTWKWHNFMAYFVLWASAVLNMIYGIELISLAGKYLNTGLTGVLAAIFFACAVFSTVTAIRLIGKYWSGVTMLRIIYAIAIVLGLAEPAITGNGNILTVITAIAMLIINSLYYGKRRSEMY